jgi:hypothetical protein
MGNHAAAESKAPVIQEVWWRFPFGHIAGNRRFETLTARIAWLAIPLEYYVLTRFTGGLREWNPVAVVFVALLTVVVVLLFSVVIAALSGPIHKFSERVRAWSISLIVNWVALVLLLTIGYAVRGGNEEDIVQYFLKEVMRLDLSQGARPYPHPLDPQTFFVYLIYAGAALGLVELIVRLWGSAAQQLSRSGPNIFILVPLTAFITMVMHGLTCLH